MAYAPLWPKPTLSPDELEDLRRARRLLENSNLAIRLANKLGTPIERGMAMLPRDWAITVQNATRKSLMAALNMAIASLDRKRLGVGSESFHKLLAGVSGGLGGAFGLASLPLELPVSTTLMLRSIADIARDEGHPLDSLNTRLSCLEVFALGSSRSHGDDAAETGYWAVRAAMSKAIAEAAALLAQRGTLESTAPAVLRLIGTIASRFGIVVSEQVAAKAVPIVGAAGGAAVNVLFMDHFQNVARGHFIIRRLELRYGPENVRGAYEQV